MSISVQDMVAPHREGRKISMVTSYDAWSARLLASSEVDSILVGDSVAMVMHGFETTVSATPEMMETHVAAVARGLGGTKPIIADMPFLSFRKGSQEALNCVEKLMQAGAHGVKIEGVRGHERVIATIVQSGVPVMGHLGLTPQSYFQLGGFRVQGREKDQADRIREDARTLEELGVFAMVLECMPSKLAGEITAELSVPSIGIGAGPDCDGQVLVLHDLMGYMEGFEPRFLRLFAQGAESLRSAVNDYHREVVKGSFPALGESYS